MNRSWTSVYDRLSSKSSQHPRTQAKTETYRVQWSKFQTILCLGRQKQFVEVPETVSRDGVQQRTVEQIVDASVPQAVEELSEVSKVFSQGRIQQRIVEQIIPAIPLAEKIVELPVIQTKEKMQRGVNTHVQHVVNAVEVEKSEIIEGTVQRKKPIIQEKINQVTRHVEIPVLKIIEKTVETPVTLLQFTDKVVNILFLAQRTDFQGDCSEEHRDSTDAIL